MMLNPALFCKNRICQIEYIIQPENDRHRAIGMLEGGMSVNAVAITFGVHRSTIWRLSERPRATGSVLNRPRSGRPKALTAREERYLRRPELDRVFERFAHVNQFSIDVF